MLFLFDLRTLKEFYKLLWHHSPQASSGRRLVPLLMLWPIHEGPLQCILQAQYLMIYAWYFLKIHCIFTLLMAILNISWSLRLYILPILNSTQFYFYRGNTTTKKYLLVKTFSTFLAKLFLTVISFRREWVNFVRLQKLV